MKNKKQKKRSQLEIQYEELFLVELEYGIPESPNIPDVSTAQTTPLRFVESVTTYGAYEDPI